MRRKIFIQTKIILRELTVIFKATNLEFYLLEGEFGVAGGA